MTLPQIWNALHQGDVPRPGEKTFGSQGEVWEYRQEMKRKAEAKQAAKHRAEVAKARKVRRGY